MTSKDYEIAKRLKAKLSEVVQLMELKVFGSRAKSTQDEYSDMDVFIKVAYLDDKLKEEIFDIVWEVGFENLMVVSPLICTQKEIEDTPLRSAPIIKNVLEEGISI
ncbi:MAG: nucleotidyltransferase domain-containing protein [bacterium]